MITTEGVYYMGIPAHYVERIFTLRNLLAIGESVGQLWGQ
jgi:hypothetical protein